MLFCLFSSSAEDYVQSLQIGAFSQNLHENIQNPKCNSLCIFCNTQNAFVSNC